MIAAFARFDLQSWLPRTQTLLPLALVVIAAVAVPVPGLAIVAGALVTSLMVSVPFLADERGRLGTLYGLLPVSRTTVVAGRAAAIVAYAVLVAVVAIVATVVVAAVRGTEVPFAWLLAFQVLAVAFVGISLALQLPVLFTLGYSRGRFIAYAPALVVAGLAWVAQATGLIASDIATPPPVLPVVAVCVGIGIAGVAIGVLVAARLYRAQEIR